MSPGTNFADEPLLHPHQKQKPQAEPIDRACPNRAKPCGVGLGSMWAEFTSSRNGAETLKRPLMMGSPRPAGGWSAQAPWVEPNAVRHGPVVPIGQFHRLPDRSRQPRPTES